MAGLVADVERGLQYLFARPDLDAERIVVFGQSLGGSIAIAALARSPLRLRVRALIVDSAFSDYRRITLEKMGDVWWLTWPLLWLPYLSVDNGFSPMHSIAKISPVPLLILHGDADRVVPLVHAQTLYAAAQAPKRLEILPGLRHIESTSKPEIRDLIDAYMGALWSARK